MRNFLCTWSNKFWLLSIIFCSTPTGLTSYVHLYPGFTGVYSRCNPFRVETEFILWISVFVATRTLPKARQPFATQIIFYHEVTKTNKTRYNSIKQFLPYNFWYFSLFFLESEQLKLFHILVLIYILGELHPSAIFSQLIFLLWKHGTAYPAFS